MAKSCKKLINELCEGVCDESHYCPLKELILVSHRFDNRFLTQFKCIEKFKYEESEKASNDIGWNDAVMRWAEEGYAKIFADLYDADTTLKQLYTKIINTHRNV